MNYCPHCKMPINNSAYRTPTVIEERYFNHTLPSLLNGIRTLNTNLEKVVNIEESEKMTIDSIVNNIGNVRFYEIIGSDFFKTRAGDKFFNYTIPALIKELERLNNNLEGGDLDV